MQVTRTQPRHISYGKRKKENAGTEVAARAEGPPYTFTTKSLLPLTPDTRYRQGTYGRVFISTLAPQHLRPARRIAAGVLICGTS
jgi:hypothetical protein